MLFQIYELKMRPDKIEFAGCHGQKNCIVYGLTGHVTARSGLRGALLLHEVSSPYSKLKRSRPDASGVRDW
jgi:hypothetical protein